MSDFLVRGDLSEVDPEVAQLIELEHSRQMHKLVMIASESYVPAAVREAEGSVFQNIYAEGYPHADMHEQTEAEILDYERQMPFFRRSADRRYYKGVEYCNVVEALAQRRGAEAFCPPHLKPEDLYLNVQPLAGAVANTAIYEAFVQPGDTVMTLDLLHGGHLSHGSPVNVTGRRQRIVHYRVNEDTERLDYEEIMELAQREKPKMIIAGYTSYPFAPDFQKFRAIADSVGALLLADIAHTAGMASAGAYPNPVGVAHVTSFTTHKTLMGPRGAVIITTDPELAKKVDRAVFPGMQGGPHMNKVAGMATMFKIAQTPEFKALQHQIRANAVALAQAFKDNGARVVHGGTNTHMVLVDCKSLARHEDEPLMGEVASRILDLIDVVCNRNTIPGDRTTPAARARCASGRRGSRSAASSKRTCVKSPPPSAPCSRQPSRTRSAKSASRVRASTSTRCSPAPSASARSCGKPAPTQRCSRRAIRISGTQRPPGARAAPRMRPFRSPAHRPRHSSTWRCAAASLRSASANA